MSDQRTENPMLGAFQSMAQGYGAQMQPVMRAALQWNTEMMAFANRRMQDYLTAPTRLASCRTPQDAMQQTMAFWQSATRDCVETSQRLLAPLNAASANVRVPAGRGYGDVPTPRDFISFPEGRDHKDPLPGAAWSGRTEPGRTEPGRNDPNRPENKGKRDAA